MIKEFFHTYFSSPLGEIEIKSDNEFIYAFHFTDEGHIKKENPSDSDLVNNTIAQLEDYFNGRRLDFNLPLQFEGTDFQKRVWTELTTINFGKTISYLQLARQLGDEKCIRAAASANGKNPFAIVVPCHRVIGTDGKLTGYAGGLWRKQWLLEHEAKASGSYNKLF